MGQIFLLAVMGRERGLKSSLVPFSKQSRELVFVLLLCILMAIVSAMRQIAALQGCFSLGTLYKGF